jgi:hypothetical protein
VEITAPVEKEMVVQFSAMAESAQHYSDFLQMDSQLTFRARGALQECTAISLMDDDLLEDDEQFTVRIRISDPALYVTHSPEGTNTTTAVVAIADDDGVTVRLERSVYEVREDVGTVSVCSILTGTTGRTLLLTLSSQPDTALAGQDYTAPVADVVFQPSPEEEQTVCVDVAVEDDEILEDEESFLLELSTSVPRITVERSTATVRVTDEDSVRVAMTDASLSVEEEGGTVSVCVARHGLIDKSVDVFLSLEARTAHAGSDFNNDRITIHFSPSTAEQRNECTTFSILDDEVVENTETFVVRLTSSEPYVEIALNETVVYINDSDRASVDFELSSYSVREEETLEVCVVLRAVIDREASVRVSTGDYTALSGADFRATDVELTFQALDSTRLCTTVPILNDPVVEEEEHFFLSLSVIDSILYVGADRGSNSSTVVAAISDTDVVIVSLVQTEVSVEEEVGVLEACIRLSGVIEKDVTVSLTTVPDTAQADIDYTPATIAIVFTPMDMSPQVNCSTIEIRDDEKVEGTETFFLQLAAGDPQVRLSGDRARIVIEDTDVVGVGFVALTQKVGEADGAATVCVELDSEVESPVSVKLATDSDTAHHPRDFNTTYRELQFEPRGDTRQCVTVTVHDDAILENEEQFLVYIFDSERSRVTDNGGGRGFVEVNTGSGVEVLSGGVRSVVVISDNDRVTIGVTQPEYTVEESEKYVNVCLKVTGDMEREVDVTLGTVDGTAKAFEDFFRASRVVTFGPHSVKEGECVRVQLIDRPEVEPNERFSVRLSSDLEGSAVVLSPREASILILDDDEVCPAETTTSPRGDYSWSQSKQGLHELPCQHSDEGVATRYCNRDGTWDLPILDDCYRDIDEIFEVLKNLPFTCHNFYDLLLAVTQATEEKSFEPEYISIVARYFVDFAEITSRDGYVMDDMTCRDDVEAFVTGVKILDLLFEWPREVLWTNSTMIMESFEVVSEHLVANPESAHKAIPYRSIAFSSSLNERAGLKEGGIMREFSANNRGPLTISESEGDAKSTVLGTIHLPPSLFDALADQEATEIGLWFSLHRTANFFTLEDASSENDSVSTPVISATLGGHAVRDLEIPVLFSLRLLNPSVTITQCASWDYDLEGNSNIRALVCVTYA